MPPNNLYVLPNQHYQYFLPHHDFVPDRVLGPTKGVPGESTPTVANQLCQTNSDASDVQQDPTTGAVRNLL